MHRNQIIVANILSEFFEIAVHNIIYIKKLYPASVFLPKRKYGVIVQQCIHPDVNSYISNALKAVNYHLGKNELKQFCLVLQSDTQIIERFVFDIINTGLGTDSDPYLLNLEQYLRDLCLKLHASNAYSDPLPENSTFTIQINTTELSQLEFNDTPLYENFPWIHCNSQETSLRNPDILPVHSIKCSSLGMQVFLEIPCEDY